jgi:hypothetical protein
MGQNNPFQEPQGPVHRFHNLDHGPKTLRVPGNKTLDKVLETQTHKVSVSKTLNKISRIILTTENRTEPDQ